MKRCAIVLAIFVCCANPSDKSTAPVKQIWPLAVGNIWVYSGVPYTDDTARVLSDTIISNEAWFLYARWGTRSLLTNRTDGLYLYDTAPGHSGARLLMRYPPASPASYVITYAPFDTLVTRTVDIGSLDTSIQTPGEHFSCIHYAFDVVTYRFNNLPVEIPRVDYCMAPGIGDVSGMQIQDSAGVNDGPDTTYWQLTSYHLN
jgi:hypothetical protein